MPNAIYSLILKSMKISITKSLDATYIYIYISYIENTEKNINDFL